MFSKTQLAMHSYTMSISTTHVLLLCTLAVKLVTLSSASSTPPVEYSVYEEIHIGTQIGNLITDAGLDRKYINNQTALNSLRFKLLNYPEPLVIEVEEKTSVLRTTTRIDRDTICAQETHCLLSYDVAVQPMHFFQIIKVVVRIVDINDNAPTFAQQYFPLEIAETSELRSSFSLPAAYDPDSPQFGIKRYRLLPANHQNFELQYELSNAAGVPDVVKIILISPLDYEEATSYQLELVASDGGDPPKTNRLPIDVVVIDDNDNPPRFDNSTYEKYVMENFPVGGTIDRVKATDDDSGLNGEIYFSLDAKTAKQYGDIFALESGTGALVLRSSLDYELNSRYVLGITATDAGSSPHTAYAQYTVHVQDVNDNAPEIRINTLTSSGLAEVPENSEVGTFIAHMSVIDLDSGEAGKVTCSINNDDFSMKELYPMEYKIVTSQVFDHEQQQETELTITCRDHGWQQLKSNARLQVLSNV